MDALSAIFRFVSLCCLWACLCFAVYGGLRLFGRRFRAATNCLGSLCLVLWGLAFGVIALFAGLSWDDAPEPYPFGPVLLMGAILLSTLGMGGLIMRQATQKQLIWWHGVLFCSLYLVLADAICWSALIFTGTSDAIGNTWDQLVAMAGVPLYDERMNVLSLFLIWIFPVGALIAEIAFHNFWQVFIANREGHPA